MGRFLRKRIKYCALVVCAMLAVTLPKTSAAQLVEDFSSPSWPYAGWVGDTAKFSTATGKLRVPDSINKPSPASVAVPYNFLAGDTVYDLQFDFEVLSVPPTSKNYVSVYLWGDSANIEKSQNALYITFNTSKQAQLFQSVGGIATSLLTTNDTIGYRIVKMTLTKTLSNRFTLIMRVCDRETSNFLRADTVSTTHVLPSAINFTQQGYFGVRFTYSKTYYNRFYLDNVNLRPLVPDTVPPAVRSAVIASSDDNNDMVLVTFNEDIDSATAVNASNYRILTMPSAQQLPLLNGTLLNANQVMLQFSKLSADELHKIRVCGVKDLAGNIMTACDTAFVRRSATDNNPPTALSAVARDENTVKITFDEVVDKVTASNVMNYAISGVNPIQVEYLGSSVLLTFALSWQELVTYNLHLENIYDLSANIMAPTDLEFVFDTTYRNLIINEILFNPQVGGEDFVEIYNKSGYAIPLSGIVLAAWDASNNRIKSVCRISDTAVLGPHDYCVVTRDTILSRRYTVLSPEKVICPLNVMPPFNNGEGTVVIALKDSTIIDRFDYTEKMHNTFLNNVKGVSLERRSFDLATQNESNWHSASKSAGYATPTYKNSQSYNFLYNEGDITIDPTVFSPDADGYNDVMNLSYSFENCDYTANVFIYDAQGRLVRRLERNAILGCNGVFSWDGTNEAKARCQIGNYVVYMEVFDAKGNKQSFKKVVTLMVR